MYDKDCSGPEEIETAFAQLAGRTAKPTAEGGGGNDRGEPDPELCYAEKWVPFVRELAVMVVRGEGSTLDTYPLVDTVQRNSICSAVLAPSTVSASLRRHAREVAAQAVAALPGKPRGVFGVELFLVKANEGGGEGGAGKEADLGPVIDGYHILYNELAPRPHNSGHYTIEACHCSQFEQHLRAISGLPLGKCDLRVGAAAMINFIGHEGGAPHLALEMKEALALPGASLHCYGKGSVRVGRKMGHYTVCGRSVEELQSHRLISEAMMEESSSSSSSSSSWKSFLGMGPRAGGGRGGGGGAGATPLVGVIMGSDSDLPCMKAACEVLEQFDIPFECTIVSMVADS